MTTTEKNILIAEFMGYEIQKDPTERFFGRYKTPITKVWVKENELSFDSDWNWLMQVVEKIDELKTPITNNPNLIGKFEDYQLEISNKHVVIYAHGEVTKDITYTKESTKIESVYNACFVFIKWYNEKNTNL